MKLFIDTANIEEIERINALGVIDGVTTNPSLIAKESGKSFEQIIREICKVVSGPVSAEVISMDAPSMIKEGRTLAKIAKNVVIKVPMTPEGLKATKAFKAEDIKTNLTLCFSTAQGLLAAKAGAAFVSPFVGRLDDCSHRGMSLIHELVKIFKNYDMQTQVLAASIRGSRNIVEAALAGAHAATLPPKIFDQMLSHPLTDRGIEAFLEDWKKSGRQSL